MLRRTQPEDQVNDYMDDIDYKQIQENLDDDDAGAPLEDTAPKRVPPQLTVGESVDVLEQFKQKLVDESYEEMLQEGEAQVKVPMEVVDALEVMLHYVNTSFEMDEEL